MSWLEFFGYDLKGGAEKKKLQKELRESREAEIELFTFKQMTIAAENMCEKFCAINKRNCYIDCVHFGKAVVNKAAYVWFEDESGDGTKAVVWHRDPHCKLWGEVPPVEYYTYRVHILPDKDQSS